MNPLDILFYYYPEDTPLRRLLLQHSEQVRDKALSILSNSGRSLDEPTVTAGAMLHDIGIGSCHAPGILCEGEEPYIRHGVIGGEMLRRYAAAHRIELEPFARICERHTGSGLSKGEIEEQRLPLPPRDFLPETPEEKLICLADKFYSKSGSRREKSLPRIRESMVKFGEESVSRLDALCRFFNVSE